MEPGRFHNTSNLEVNMKANSKTVIPHTYSSGLRMAEFVKMLYEAKFPLYLTDMAEGLGIHYKVMERYIRFMREKLVSGGECVFVEEKDGKGRKIRLRDNWVSVPANAYQAASANMALKMMSFLRNTAIPEGLEDIYHGVRVDNKSALKLDRKFHAINIGQKDYSEKEGLISDILLSLIKETQLLLTYKGRKHRVKPYTLLTYKAGLYLVGFTDTYKEIRMFAIDRISELLRSKEKFTYPADYSPETYFKDTFGITSGTVEKVVLKFNKKRAPYIKERTWHRTAKYEEKDGSLFLSMECPITPELKQWILSCGGDVEVIGPALLKNEIIAEARAILKSNKSLKDGVKGKRTA